MSTMPTLPLNEFCKGLNDLQSKLIRAAFTKQGKLRAAKPFRKVDYDKPNAFFEACANYVWRMLCFDYCDFHPHNCMPVTAEWDIEHWHLRRWYRRGREAIHRITNDLDTVIKLAESNVSATLQRGVLRWGRLV